MNNTWREIIKFSLPLTFLGILDLLVVLVDFAWLFIFTNDANVFSALRVSSSIVLLVEIISASILSAILVYVSQNYGAAKLDMVHKGLKNGISTSFFSGIFISLIGLTCLPLLISLFGLDREVHQITNQYLLFLFGGYVIISINNFLLLLPRFFDKVKYIYRGMSIILISNILLVPCAIILFSKMGMNPYSATAFSTVISNLICLIYLLMKIYVNDKLNIQLSLKEISFRLDWTYFFKNRKYILSEIFSGISYNASIFIYTLILSHYPGEVFRIYSITSYLYMFFSILAQNFALSAIPLVSKKIGEGNYFEIKKLIKTITFIIAIFGFLVSIPIIFLKSDLAYLLSGLNGNTKLFEIFIMCYTLPWVFNLISIVFVYVAAAAGDSKGINYLTISNMYLLVILPIVILPHFFSSLTLGVIITMSLIQLLTFINSMIYYLRGSWSKSSLVESNNQIIN
ncbi:MATE family efflux transporter [Paenibacillus sp. PsM32]|uniref:MATE family efflux transporter n=1 Tax=Paenibacillus sp. PsM32 TaxID=3030536 RepID=UPI00263ABA81|nr:MATE family efflux transporter [Paenibacillus sp. PsM32]MDN4621096.1 MATE family efflux transporter [Paenibacillus sp. PsM32]